MHQSIFITGTDTGVGKTLVSALLCSSGKYKYWKPVQAGLEEKDCDEVLKHTKSDLIVPSVYEYKLPMSPNQAAYLDSEEGVCVGKLISRFDELKNEKMVIEGAGGMMVPLNHCFETWFDFLEGVDISVLVVARSGLGTLNHTQLTVDKLLLSSQNVCGIVLSGPVHNENYETLQSIYPDIPIFNLDHVTQVNVESRAQNLQLFIEEIKQGDICDDTVFDDKKYCWHPYLQHKNQRDPFVFKKAKGAWLYTECGKKLFDASSSWWVNSIGHGNKVVSDAIYRQQKRLDHVLFSGATHKEAVSLSKCLESYFSDAKCFYSDNGSCAVEIALKMAYQMFKNRGIKNRKKILTLTGSYHGDTIGAMSLSDTSGFHEIFKDLMFETSPWRPVLTHKSDLGSDESKEDNLEKLDRFLKQFGHEYCAVVLEPFVQGAGGMLVHDPLWLKEFSLKCREHGLVVIFDEIFVGMGRLGDISTARKLGFEPDIICLGKGLTGGNLPLAVTMAKNKIFEAFLGDDKKTALLHGHSYTANPICVSAANATLKFYKEQGVLENVSRIEKQFLSWTGTRQDKIENPRVCGAVLAFELKGSGSSNYHSSGVQEIVLKAYENQLFLRTLGNTVYLVPPLVSSEGEINFALSRLERTIEI